MPLAPLCVLGEDSGGTTPTQLWVCLGRSPRQKGYLLILEERRGRPTAEELAKRFGLPPKRAEVLRLLAEGRSNAEIGEALYVSPRTVGKHLELTYRDLSVDSRAEAIARVNEA